MHASVPSKRVLLIGGNFYPEPTGIGKYNGELIDQLASQGYQCTVITSYPYYPYWKVQQPYAKHFYWYKRELRICSANETNPVEIFRCPLYVPKKPTAWNRMILDFTFSISSLFMLIQLMFRKRYDHVIAVAPGFHIGFLGLLYKLVRRAKFIYHIQDLQIDAAIELKMIKSKTLINVLLWMEKFILRNADIVSSISVGMIRKISQKCKRDVAFLPNWVDTKFFYPLAEQAKLKEEFNLKPSDRVVLYSGAIGEKQGLENIILAADELRHLDDVKFVICGSGPYRVSLEKIAKEKNLKNVTFLPLQPAEKLNRFLNVADIHLVLQKASAADLFMPSKLSAILSVGGLAIITGAPASDIFETISTNNIGILVDPDDKNSLKDTIASSLNSNYENIRSNARKYAEETLAKEKIFSQFMSYMR